MTLTETLAVCEPEPMADGPVATEGVETAVVVLSCSWSPYAETERAWRARHARYWPDCPWGVRWCSDDVRGRPWGDFVVEAFAALDAEIAFVVMGDVVAVDPVDTAQILRCHAEMIELDADYYRVVPTPECTTLFAHGEAGWHDPELRDYVKSLQPSFWRRDHLAFEASGVSTAWEFETTPLRRPDARHAAVARHIRPYSGTEMIRRGEWTDEGRRILAEER